MGENTHSEYAKCKDPVQPVHQLKLKYTDVRILERPKGRSKILTSIYLSRKVDPYRPGRRLLR